MSISGNSPAEKSTNLVGNAHKPVSPYPAQTKTAVTLDQAVRTPVQFLRPMERQRGRIELIMGCMFAGKTTELLRRCNKHNITGKRVLRVKFSADKRYGSDFKISTHSGQKQPARPINLLSDLGDEWMQFDVIGVDEGQFFADIVEFSELAANNGKVVIISSLQGTFMRGAFPNILTLIPKCEKIKKLTAICKLCKQNASFTFRTASKDCHTMIGGENMYMPLCRECHDRESQLNASNQYIGDPSKISVELENKQFAKTSDSGDIKNQTPVGAGKQFNKTPTSSLTATTASGDNDSPKAKSFTSSEDSLERDNEITLRKINQHNSLKHHNRSEERHHQSSNNCQSAEANSTDHQV